MGEAVHELPKDKWDLMMDLNARTLLNTAEAVVPGMIEAGAARSSPLEPMRRAKEWPR